MSRPSAYPQGRPIAVSGDQVGSYEALARFILQRRLRNVLTYSLAVTWATISLATNPLDGLIPFILHPFRLWTIFWAIFSFSFGVLPIIVYRKMSLTPCRLSSAGSLASQLRKTISSPSAWRAILVYTVSGVVLSLAFALIRSPDWEALIWKPTRMYSWHLNEAFIVLLASNFYFGLGYAFLSVMHQRSVINWPSTDSKTHPETTTVYLLQRGLSRSLKYFVLAWVNFGTVYLLFRKPSYHFLNYLLKPLIKHFIRRGISWTDVYLPTFFLNLATGTVWYISETLFVTHASQPVNISQHTVGASPTECLASGLTSKSTSGYYQRFAFAEMSEIAQGTGAGPASRRKALFSDLRNPTPWSTFCREALLVLGRDYQNLLNKGMPKPPPPPPAAGSLNPKPTLNEIHRTPSIVKKVDIYSHALRSPSERIIDNVAGYLSTADQVVDRLPGVPEPVNELRKSLAGKVPALFASTSSPQLAIAGEQPATGPVANAPLPTFPQRMWGNLKQRMPSPVRSAVEVSEHRLGWLNKQLNQERVVLQLNKILPNIQLDIWTIEALCHLTARSFTEDPYGVVQKDIPKILEAILLLDQAVGRYLAELVSKQDAASETSIAGIDDEETIRGCVHKVERLREALRLGLHAIITTFQDRLTAFKFSPSTAKMLQDLVDHNL